jgi:hypothetical protein
MVHVKEEKMLCIRAEWSCGGEGLDSGSVLEGKKTRHESSEW